MNRSMQPKSVDLGSALSSTALRYRACAHVSLSDYHHGLTARPFAFFNQADRTVKNESGGFDSQPEDKEAKIANLEAILFMSHQPLSTRRLAKLAKLEDGTEARALVRKLQARYNRQARAFQVVEVAGGLQLMTRPRIAQWLDRLHGQPVEMSLSAPAMETLSVVAYRQPIVRAEIEAIRGVQCGELLRVLMERDLLRITGKSKDLGRPFLYGTTTNFLKIFGLRRIEDLPTIDQKCNHAPTGVNRAA